MGQLINGKEIAAKIREEIKKTMGNKENKKKIVSILVGNDGGSIYYQNFQEKMSKELLIDFDKIKLDENTTKSELESLIKELNKDDSVGGIMLLLPLPKHLKEDEITNLIDSSKDLDCLSDRSVGEFYKGISTYVPCTPYSVITLLKAYNVNLEGANVVIVGRSNIVGKPLAQMFLNENATVTICHSRTKNLRDFTKKAEILVLAMGKPKFIDSSYVSENSIVIDVGTTPLDGKITGDVDFEMVKDKVKLITPVPGGVGALTTTLLFKNFCEGLK
ncbi:MAG: tetrahydrofolate dehydrogenase/cyclohydrolase catalytic domain-containing protein [Sarcina sp.]